MDFVRITTALGFFAFVANPVSARGILGQKAPSWGVTEWKNLPEGKKQLDLEDFKSKVVYLYCFQSWCPGCHRYGFPTLKKAISRFKGNKDVTFVAVQTVFEGASVNTPAKAWSTAKRYDLKIPVGPSGDE
ncbi:MAG: redoxin family protein, partial [Planctomycetota bacterium]|nr:redoxin family protein [Planctomycetota bacterium]